MSDATEAMPATKLVQALEATDDSTGNTAATSITNGNSIKVTDEGKSVALATTKHVLTADQPKEAAQAHIEKAKPVASLAGGTTSEATEVFTANMKIREGETEVQEVSIEIRAEQLEVSEQTGPVAEETVGYKEGNDDICAIVELVLDQQKKNAENAGSAELRKRETATAAKKEALQEPCNFRIVVSDIDDVNTRANAERIQNVENCFGSSGQSLRAPGRVLVGEGVLTKMCRKKPKPRQVFLFNDILVYGNILIPKKKYIKQHIIPLEKVCLENIEESADMCHGWVVRTPTKSFVVFAASRTEKQQWMTHITTCINELLKKTGKHPSKEHAAVWVPDSDAGKCMVCKETKFTLLNRRHHCRKCGCVVCGNCSQHKFMLPAQSSKPLRVCDSCFDILSMGKGDFADIDLSSVPNAQDSRQPTKNELRAAAKEQLSSSRDDTTDDSDDDEDDVPNQCTEQVQLKEEKPTFYSGDDANKDAPTEKDQSTTVRNAAKKDDTCYVAQEKFDSMKITTEQSGKTN
ncbi:pleckstrin homology domain-containing family F member 1 homolog isoform X2 [Varroa jacobsoni]|uniref:Uncharacterized protein n=1 Tax=Varroa destructor TaxID=109461 RepID=A0A7M7JGT6_VARDE|nr:pleckstrin homology domain-containing family F member 1 homolog isoform X2 [Varroa destructor]XP_022706255.1 pleckstrin homology domain-containing family F member 1 homolog isoform X2 [Varroa jacobsoni]